MGIAAASRLEPATVKTPWRLSLFLLAIFALASFDPSRAFQPQQLSLDETLQQIENGSAQCRIALFCFGFFGLVALTSPKGSRLRVNGILGWSMLFFISLALASPAWAEDSSLTIRRVGVLVLLSLGAMAVATRLSQVQTAALAVCVCSFTLIISLAVEIVSGTFRPLEGAWRFSGVLYSVTQGWNCGLLVIASLAMARVLPRSRNRFILLALVALLFLALTRSRMALASTIFAIAVCGSLVSRKARELTFVSAYLLLCATLLWVSLGGDLGRAAVSIATLGRGEEEASNLDTFTGRVQIWHEALGYVRARPILGYGYNSFFSPRNLPAITQATGWAPLTSHSGYIGTLLGLGCVGGATFLVLLLVALRRSISLARKGPSAAFAAAVMIWLCCNLFLESAIITDPNFPAFICMVVLASLSFKENMSCPSIRLSPRPTIRVWRTWNARKLLDQIVP